MGGGTWGEGAVGGARRKGLPTTRLPIQETALREWNARSKLCLQTIREQGSARRKVVPLERVHGAAPTCFLSPIPVLGLGQISGLSPDTERRDHPNIPVVQALTVAPSKSIHGAGGWRDDEQTPRGRRVGGHGQEARSWPQAKGEGRAGSWQTGKDVRGRWVGIDGRTVRPGQTVAQPRGMRFSCRNRTESCDPDLNDPPPWGGSGWAAPKAAGWIRPPPLSKLQLRGNKQKDRRLRRRTKRPPKNIQTGLYNFAQRGGLGWPGGSPVS